MEILGYGEDALTYWYLTEKMAELLNILEDKSNIKDCLVIYRPSFGRRGGNNSAQFGEFDSILATPKSIYLIESKQFENQEAKKGLLNVQTLRHELFKWYFINWDENKYGTWDEFVVEQRKEFSGQFRGKKVMVDKGRLAGNLKFVINRLRSVCATNEVKNILVVFKPNNCKNSASIIHANAGFQMVGVNYDNVPDSNYIKM